MHHSGCAECDRTCDGCHPRRMPPFDGYAITTPEQAPALTGAARVTAVGQHLADLLAMLTADAVAEGRLAAAIAHARTRADLLAELGLPRLPMRQRRELTEH